jgi:hypothetical protein
MPSVALSTRERNTRSRTSARTQPATGAAADNASRQSPSNTDRDETSGSAVAAERQDVNSL